MKTGRRTIFNVSYPAALDKHLYWQHRLVDNAFLALKQWRGIAIRYPLSAIRYPLSAIRYPLSAIRYPESIIAIPKNFYILFYDIYAPL